MGLLDPVGAGRGMVNPALTPGNIDLFSRPIVRNKDGSISTVRSMSVNFGGPEVLIPTVAADGSKILNDEEAIRQYLRTRQHLGMFNNVQSANEYANSLHNQQEQLYTAPRGLLGE